MIIKNVKIYTEEKTFREGTIYVDNEKIVKINFDAEVAEHEKYEEHIESMEAAEETDKKGEQIVDGAGAFAIPGLVDIHFHGCVGSDFCDGTEEAIAKMAEYEASVGVTSICPASMTISEEEIHRVMKTAGAYSSKKGAKLVGINMEGPFINEKKKGAQAAEHIQKCNVELFERFQEEAHGLIKLVDIAPETEGAMEFIDQIKDQTVVSIAHTLADYDTAKKAFQRGASHVTHLYNAMPPFNHRDPGVIGAARDHEKCHVELICDGVHIHPSVIRATFEMFGPERVILISDSMRATGLSDGEYTLGGQKVFVKGAWATLADGTIAGSATNLMDCMKYAVKEAHISLEDAIACATQNPAKEIGIYDSCGSISVGKTADLVFLNQNLDVTAVYVKGQKI